MRLIIVRNCQMHQKKADLTESLFGLLSMTFNIIMATTGKVILSEWSLGLSLISDQIKKHPSDKSQTEHTLPHSLQPLFFCKAELIYRMKKIFWSFNTIILSISISESYASCICFRCCQNRSFAKHNITILTGHTEYEKKSTWQVNTLEPFLTSTIYMLFWGVFFSKEIIMLNEKLGNLSNSNFYGVTILKPLFHSITLSLKEMWKYFCLSYILYNWILEILLKKHFIIKCFMWI